MKMVVVGAGYVGLTTGACLASAWAENTHGEMELVFVEIVKEKVDSINSGKLPIFEPGLEEIFNRLHSSGAVRATTNYDEAISGADMVLMVLPTPSRQDGSIDISFVEAATRSVATAIRHTKSMPLLVYRSTVLPGTTERMREIIKKEFGLEAGKDYLLCMNPEHLQEGTAVKNFMQPDKLIIGEHDLDSGKRLLDFYMQAGLMPPEGKTFRMGLREAEMEKYFSNAFLAIKITFANQMANLCESFGVNYDTVRDAACTDRRLGPAFTTPGIGFGGSCFSKDVNALAAGGKSAGTDVSLLKEVLRTNDVQPASVAALIDKLHGLNGKKVAVLGVAFKGETDDLRATMTLPFVKELQQHGAEVLLTDPYADNAAVKNMFGLPLLQENDALKQADLVVIGTDHKRYKEMKIAKPVFDAKHFVRGVRSIGGMVA